MSHAYIEKCLDKFGVGNFIPVFRTLYRDLKSDVIINGRITKGYLIKRGVKQGDALSCILFIMCMEPLLRNINNNNEIVPLGSMALNTNLPKTYAYADDVNIVTCNQEESVQGIFQEYERLSKLSGLVLNANKTEILRIKSGMRQNRPVSFAVNYLNEVHRIETCEQVKINGILLQQDRDLMAEGNLNAVKRKIEGICSRWSRRRLCLLGKILILKTYGISQIIYLLQCFALKCDEVKRLNAILYKFLWNRHFEAAKAPERISREIINTPIQKGGFGMLSVEELGIGLKLRAVGRLFGTRHPMLSIIKDKLNIEEFFYPKISTNLDSIAIDGINLLGESRRKLWDCEIHSLDMKSISLIRAMKLNSVVNRTGLNSLAYFAIRQAGKSRLEELNVVDINRLARFLPKNLIAIAKHVVNLNVNADIAILGKHTVIGNKIVELATLSSKAIRDGRADSLPICLFRSGILNSPTETLTWANKVNALTNTRHKDVLLRVAHREYYTKERLHRYRLIDSPTCPRCDQIEDYEHKILSCTYVSKIWVEAFRVTDRIYNPPNGVEIIRKITGMELGTNRIVLTLHSELLNRIFQIKDEANFLLRPKIFVRLAIEHLIKRETKEEIKQGLKDLLI